LEKTLPRGKNVGVYPQGVFIKIGNPLFEINPGFRGFPPPPLKAHFKIFLAIGKIFKPPFNLGFRKFAPNHPKGLGFPVDGNF